MTTIRQAVGGLLGSAAAGTIFRPLVRGSASIFMLHRFRVPDLGIDGHDPVVLRRVLAVLRREGVQILSLEQLFENLASGRRWSRPVAAFTIDDGYLDQAMVGAPVFAEFDCPVTTFVTSGFLDGALWFWWDRIAYTFAVTKRTAVSVRLGDERFTVRWAGPRERDATRDRFTNLCKEVPDAVKLAAIDALAEAAEVSLPADPPPAYAPMSWDDLRAAETHGMRFGPHTVTHPVLAQATTDQSRYEITESWARLSSEAMFPVPIFCYPNGRRSDFGARELAVFREVGIRGGVIGEIGYASHARYSASQDAPFEVPRFAYHEAASEMMQMINGVERFKQMLSGRG